jgi:hypothetical protein
MGEWCRETPWRQGCVLSQEALQALFPHARDGGFDVAVIISHDCDLAQIPDIEPNVELILGKRIGQLDGGNSYAKNARRLNLSFTKGCEHLYVDMLATQKVLLAKDRLAGYEPHFAVKLTGDEHAILQRWLSARYRRSSFPDEFDKRLADARVPDRLTKILKPFGAVIVAMYFDVDKGEEVHHEGKADPYELLIYLLYTGRDDPQCLEKAEAAAKKINELFQAKFFDKASKSWSNVELEGCIPVSDEAMTYAQSFALKRWNGDHISLRAEPQQPLDDDSK